MNLNNLVVLIKGAGEIVSAVAYRLMHAGFRVRMVEIAEPKAVHRGTTFSDAIFGGEKIVEGLTARLCKYYQEMLFIWGKG